MINYFFILLAIQGVSSNAEASPWHYQTRGYLYTKLSAYTEEQSRNYGQLTRAQYEQTTELQKNIEAKNQLRWTTNSIDSDLSNKSTPSKKDIFEVYPGENYIKYKSESWVAQLGYQEVIWGESFGFNYADIINPKDNRQTFFSDAADSRLPILLTNIKSFFTTGSLSGSFQFLYSPKPEFSKTLPVDIYASNIFPQNHLTIIKEKKPDILESSDIGGKISGSYNGFDMAIFYFSYLDREPHYIFQSASPENIILKEEHTSMTSSGISLTGTIFNLVFRTDIVYSQDKVINFIENSSIKTFSTNSLNTLISFDTPTYNHYSGSLIFANSTLQNTKPYSFREINEQYLIGKISKNLGNEKTLDLSYLYDINHSGNSIQTYFSWPVNNSTDIKFGGEFYFGNEQSNLKKLNNIFFSIKNYFHI